MLSRISKRNSYIGEATISRKLLAQYLLAFSDATIAGAVSYNGGYLVIDSNGKAVEQLTEYPTIILKLLV